MDELCRKGGEKKKTPRLKVEAAAFSGLVEHLRKRRRRRA